MKRKQAIGGWLLYYFLSLFVGSFVLATSTAVSLLNYHPAAWPNAMLYLLFLVSSVPGVVVKFAQVGLSTKMLPESTRSWRYVNILRLVLALEILFTLIAMPIDLTYWPEHMMFTALGLIWPIIWLFYFSYSKRVRAVYGSKDWDWEALHQKEIAELDRADALVNQITARDK